MGNYIQCHVIYNGKEYGKESILIYIYNDILIYIYIYVYREGNGNPLQYSCLENPRDGGAWWAAVYGVTQSDD